MYLNRHTWPRRVRGRTRQTRIDAPAGADIRSPGVAPAGSAQAYSGRITGPGSGSPAGLAPLRPARAARSRRDGLCGVPLGCLRGGFSLAGLRPIKEGLCSVRPAPSARLPCCPASGPVWRRARGGPVPAPRRRGSLLLPASVLSGCGGPVPCRPGSVCGCWPWASPGPSVAWGPRRSASAFSQARKRAAASGRRCVAVRLLGAVIDVPVLHQAVGVRPCDDDMIQNQNVQGSENLLELHR